METVAVGYELLLLMFWQRWLLVVMWLLLAALLQLQLHDGVDVVRLNPRGVELDAPLGVSAAIFSAATGEGGMVHLKTHGVVRSGCFECLGQRA